MLMSGIARRRIAERSGVTLRQRSAREHRRVVTGVANPLGRLLILVCLTLSLAFGLGANQVRAQDDSGIPLRIIIVDVQLALRSSSAAQSIREQVDAARAVFEQQLIDFEEALREEEAELATIRADLTEQEFADRQVDLERRVLDAQRTIHDGNAAIDQAMSVGMTQVQAALVAEIVAIAEAENASIVLDKADVVLVSQDLDRTSAVIDGLNARLPSIELPTLTSITAAQ